MAEKLALIDKDLLMRLLSRNVPPAPPHNPVLKQMERLDNQLQSTLESSNVSDRIKSRKVNELLFKHDNFNKQYENQIGPQIPIASQATASADRDAWTSKTVSTAPLKNKKITEALMEHIKSSDRLGWDGQGRLMIDGAPIQNTNILDLVHAVTRRRIKTKTPEGTSEFINVLDSINTPRELLPNLDYLKNGGLDRSPDRVMARVVPPPKKLLRIPQPSPYVKRLRGARAAWKKKLAEMNSKGDVFSTPRGSKSSSPSWGKL